LATATNGFKVFYKYGNRLLKIMVRRGKTLRPLKIWSVESPRPQPD